jgi:DNA (cytosine-5)-methyltransferase 1
MVKSNQLLVLHKRTNPARPGHTCVDLFSGAGGLAVGFRQAGWSVLAANDSDKDAGVTFRLNFPEAAFFEGPIGALTAAAILKECGLKAGELDCLVGGPPCQSFSYNNHQRSAEGERAQLFRDYLRLVKGLKPKMLIMENVPGILTIGENAVIGEISELLANLGYDTQVRVLSAEEFGAPQVRRRVFIVASRVGPAETLLPRPTHRPAEGARRPAASRSKEIAPRAIKRPITVGQAIGDLPRLKSGGGTQKIAYGKRKPTTEFQKAARKAAKQLHNHVCHALTEAMLERIKHVPEGGNWRNIPFKLLTDGMKRARPQDHTKRYGRLSRKGLASTILTKCDPHWGAYIHPTQNRTISVREAARLQGFPDRFVFAGEHSSKQYTQVGNAVPVPIARALGLAASSHLKEITQKKRPRRERVEKKARRTDHHDRKPIKMAA